MKLDQLQVSVVIESSSAQRGGSIFTFNFKYRIILKAYIGTLKEFLLFSESILYIGTKPLFN